MLCFFHMTEDVKVLIDQYNFTYSHEFKGVPNQKQIPIECIHVTTPSDYQKICQSVKASGKDDKQICRLLSVKEISEHELMPKRVSFCESLEEAFSPFEDKDTITVAVMNAVSNALGDYLIGINAFNVYQEKLKEKYPDKKFVFNFFQLNPYRLSPITKQWSSLYEKVGTMPVSLNLFYSHDAYMDFGGLLMVESFNTQPMYDFFLEGFSMKNENVPPERKRLKYTTMPSTDMLTGILNKHIRKRANGKPVILVHPLSTTPIRTMPEQYANRLVKELNKKGYFTISAVSIPSKSKSHMNLHNFSENFDDFAGIVKMSDGMVTVDTVTTHLADCFDVPTVALFTSIDPKYRVSYYPKVKGIMLEKEDGLLYGKHKYDPNTEEGKQAEKYAAELWDEKPPKEVTSELSKLLIHKV